MAAKTKFDKSINKSSIYRDTIIALGGPDAASNAQVKSHVESIYDGWEWGSNPAAAIGQVRKSMLQAAGKPVPKRTKKVAKKKPGRKPGRKPAVLATSGGSSSAVAVAAALSFLTSHNDAEAALAKARDIVQTVGPDLAKQWASMLAGN
ncbi:MAG: hypothetical protein C0478_04835 [Planctomyces sp.]|nr:hypothetical protein [Planctomyces sp.]